MAMTLDREAELARRIRLQLGEFNDDNKAVETLVRELAEHRLAHLSRPAQVVDVGVISRAVEGWRVYEAGGYGLVAYHHEWGELRGDTRDKPAKQWALIATLRDVITATRALGNAQAEGWRVPEGFVPVGQMEFKRTKQHARIDVAICHNATLYARRESVPTPPQPEE